METSLQNIEAWCWRYTENTRNYPGLHLTARPAACDALADGLQRLRREGEGARRTISLRQLRPEDEARVSGGQKYECFSRLRVTLHGESELLRQMSFRVENGTVHFDFTERSLAGFERGLSDVRSGTGDYSIAPRQDRRNGLRLGELDRASERLWFWPCFGHLQIES